MFPKAAEYPLRNTRMQDEDDLIFGEAVGFRCPACKAPIGRDGPCANCGWKSIN